MTAITPRQNPCRPWSALSVLHNSPRRCIFYLPKIKRKINNLKIVYILCCGISTRVSWESGCGGLFTLLSMSVAVSCPPATGTAWHRVKEKHWKDGQQLLPPRTPFVSSGRQFQSIKCEATNHLDGSYHRADSITNPLKARPLHAALCEHNMKSPRCPFSKICIVSTRC